jgi:hypothetical protein
VKLILQHVTIRCDNESTGKLFTPSFATVRGRLRSEGTEGHVVTQKELPAEREAMASEKQLCARKVRLENEQIYVVALPS